MESTRPVLFITGGQQGGVGKAKLRGTGGVYSAALPAGDLFNIVLTVMSCHVTQDSCIDGGMLSESLHAHR